MLLNQLTETLQVLKDEVRQKYKADMKGIFGSYARGEAGEYSDIDIFAEFHEGATLLDMSGMRNFLEEELQRKVDVVSQAALRDEISANVYRDMVSL